MLQSKMEHLNSNHEKETAEDSREPENTPPQEESFLDVSGVDIYDGPLDASGRPASIYYDADGHPYYAPGYY